MKSAGNLQDFLIALSEGSQRRRDSAVEPLSTGASGALSLGTWRNLWAAGAEQILHLQNLWLPVLPVL